MLLVLNTFCCVFSKKKNESLRGRTIMIKKKWSFTSVRTSLEIFCYLSCELAVSVLFGFGLFKALNTPPTLIQGFAGSTCYKILRITR